MLQENINTICKFTDKLSKDTNLLTKEDFDGIENLTLTNKDILFFADNCSDKKVECKLRTYLYYEANMKAIIPFYDAVKKAVNNIFNNIHNRGDK